jgi:lactoylglutathione lyase
MKFLHTMIRVTDIEKSIKFYTDILDMKLVNTLEIADAKLYFMRDKSGCCEIELTYNKEQPENGYVMGNQFGHFAFATDSMDSFTEKIKKHKIEYYIMPFDVTPKGPTIAFIKDPDGFMIELIERKE